MLRSLRLRHALLLVLLTACGSSVAVDEGLPDVDDTNDGDGEDGGRRPSEDAGADADTTVDDDDDDAAPPVDAGADAPTTDAGRDAAPPVDAGDGGVGPTVTVGAPNRILLKGTVISPDVTFVGSVLVEDQLITCAAAGTTCEQQPNANGATVIQTNGVIAPGLIDTHNHILFDIFDGDDWLPAKVYKNHDEWPKEARYQAMLDVKQCLVNDSQGKPAWCGSYGTAAGSLRCEVDKWGELKGMIAGTTSIVGLPGTSSACFGSLSRSIDAPQNGLGQDKIQTSSLFPPSKSSADGVCNNYASLKTDAYLIHVGEGTDARSLAEFTTLGSVTTTAGCLYAPQTVVTHGTAFGAAEFATMGQKGVKLTWSPASNVALYGATTDVLAARAADVLVSLAPDWSMGGSQNLLDEMRFADKWDDTRWQDKLSAKDIVLMTTKNPAAALGLSARIGTIEPGKLADLVVVSSKDVDPYASLLAARPRDVRITMIGGRILYGDAALKAAAPATPGCEDVDICGIGKFLCVAESSTSDKLNQTYAQIKSILEAALVATDTASGRGYNFAPLAPLVKCD